MQVIEANHISLKVGYISILMAATSVKSKHSVVQYLLSKQFATFSWVYLFISACLVSYIITVMQFSVYYCP